MQKTTLTEGQRTLNALEAAEALNESVKNSIGQFRQMESGDFIKKATKLLLSGNITLEAIGLPANFFEQVEQLDKLNSIARAKLRAYVVDELAELKSATENSIEEVAHEQDH